MNNEIIKKALKELNEEGLLNGLNITEKGKEETERVLREDNKSSDMVFRIFLKKLEDDFYELSPVEFSIKVLELERLLSKSNVDLYSKLIKMKDLNDR